MELSGSYHDPISAAIARARREPDVDAAREMLAALAQPIQHHRYDGWMSHLRCVCGREWCPAADEVEVALYLRQRP